MREEQLLDRIRSQVKDPAKRVTGDPGKVVRSILGHLQRMLNTGKGSVSIAYDYGMPDLTYLMPKNRDSKRDFERAIRQTIQKYEPRLEAVRVKFEDQEEKSLSVSFQITARLTDVPKKDPIFFRILKDSDGKLTIRE